MKSNPITTGEVTVRANLPSAVYVFCQDGNIVLSTSPPPAGHFCAEFVLNNTGTVKTVKVFYEDEENITRAK